MITNNRQHGPDWCSPVVILVIVLLGMVVALIVTLSALQDRAAFWASLGTNALFIQWVALTSVAVLCCLRHASAKYRRSGSPWLAFIVVQTVVLAYSLTVVYLPFYFGSRDLLAARDPLIYVARNLSISILAGLVLVRYLALQQRWKNQVAAESRARLQSLQARIRPHFLFNALNTIASLIRSQPDKAEEATLDLADLLRSGLRGEVRHTLAVELELVRGYLRLEALRLGERLQVEWDLDADLPGQQRIPALLLQPLVENAVVHGIARLPDGGCLVIAGQRAGKHLRFRVENPVPEDDPADTGSPQPTGGNRMALDNIRQRLELAYADHARMDVARRDGRFQVELRLPAEEP